MADLINVSGGWEQMPASGKKYWDGKPDAAAVQRMMDDGCRGYLKIFHNPDATPENKQPTFRVKYAPANKPSPREEGF